MYLHDQWRRRKIIFFLFVPECIGSWVVTIDVTVKRLYKSEEKIIVC